MPNPEAEQQNSGLESSEPLSSEEQLIPKAAERGESKGRKQLLLRLDPAVYAAIMRWANDELRSVNAQIEVVLRNALADSKRLPKGIPAPRRPGRPNKDQQ